MKVLWFSNLMLSADDLGATGTWLLALADKISTSGAISLANITAGPVDTIVRKDCGGICQWMIPAKALHGSGALLAASREGITSILSDFAPDLVHVWGTELPWGHITAENELAVPALLEIQGLKKPVSRVYSGGLTAIERCQCLGVKELLKGRNIGRSAREFARWGEEERSIISRHQYVSTPSPWAESWVRSNNAGCRVFHNELMLRKPFYEAAPWSYHGAPVIFCSSAYPAPYKGLHDAVRALAELRGRMPDATLRIAGSLLASGLRQDGYISWLRRLIDNLGLSEHVCWLGPLSAEQIVKELHNCSAMLIPSYCESYCVALAEAMYLGVPAVTTFTGGSAWLATDMKTALFYQPGDERFCASNLERLITDQRLASDISSGARDQALKRNDPSIVVANQLEIYRNVVAESVGGGA